MKTLKFKCTLLSDVILNTSAATQGEQSSLDFIPGNNFLGIVAADYGEYSPAEQMEIFHSGKVRFGDAHPALSDSKTRSLHVPATLFYPKGKYAWEECYAFQSYSRKEDIRVHGKPMQLKQCRNGYYIFDNGEGKPVSVEKSFAIKSAYERTLRRSKDSQMYGYESIDEGQSFLFEVEVDNDSIADKIGNALIGIHHIGRSRTAQYGMVEIEKFDFNEVPSRREQIDTIDGKRIAVYADSRLIFFDKDGQPTFQPTAKQLGLDGEIDWDVSQVRTFQYAPWNGKRQTRDADRCGIEKGSVFFVKSDSVPSGSQYVGSYNNEGFGKVIYNPDFLLSKGENGKAEYDLLKVEEKKGTAKQIVLGGTPLLDYVAASRKNFETEGDIAALVNQFASRYKGLFAGISASQWGTIRNIAMTHPTRDGIIYELFDKKEKQWHWPSVNDSFEGYREEEVGYLTHGIAKNKWKKNGRREKLKDFILSIKDADFVQQAVVNLASVMAKNCTHNGNN